MVKGDTCDMFLSVNANAEHSVPSRTIADGTLLGVGLAVIVAGGTSFKVFNTTFGTACPPLDVFDFSPRAPSKFDRYR